MEVEDLEIVVDELDPMTGGGKKKKTLTQVQKDIQKGKLVYHDGKALTEKQLLALAKKRAKKGKRLELKSMPPVAGG